MTSGDEPRETLLSPAYIVTTAGMFALIVFNAFEVLAVTTVMPTVARELGGLQLYAISFAGPLAASVVGMVAAGQWSDRSGPRRPMVLALLLFAAGLLIAGVAPSMEILVAGRVIQGLGGGAFTVVLYVMVGLVYPPRLQPAVFASFAAAWVLPSLFGPAVAAAISHAFGWRWVFLGVVILVGAAAVLVAPALRRLPRPDPPSDLESDLQSDRESDHKSGADPGGPGRRTALGWAVVAAAAVASIDLLGSTLGWGLLFAALALVVLLFALRWLLPVGTLAARRGLPAVIGDRALMSAGFFCSETYVAFVLQDRWDLSPGRAGIALSVVGIVWAASSQLQSRIGARITDERAMLAGAVGLAIGASLSLLVVFTHAHAALLVLGFAISGAGMGFGYPRTGTAMLRHSSDADRGFNSSAIAIADALGGALALAMAGIGFTALERTENPFLGAFGIGALFAVGAVVVASRTSSLGAVGVETPTLKA